MIEHQSRRGTDLGGTPEAAPAAWHPLRVVGSGRGRPGVCLAVLTPSPRGALTTENQKLRTPLSSLTKAREQPVRSGPSQKPCLLPTSAGCQPTSAQSLCVRPDLE